MKVAILEEAGKIVVQEIPDLTPGPDDVLIKTRYAGICGSDLHTYQGHHPFRKPPVILGHEISGTVVGYGKNVDGFNEGDEVTVMPLSSCGTCRLCRKDKPNLCLKREMPGVNDWQGTFAEYFLSKPAITYKIGEHIDLKTGLLAEPLSVGIHAARLAGLRSKSNSLVLGGGPIGILTAAAAKIGGAENIVLTDLFQSNMDVAEKLIGAKTYIADAPNLTTQIKTDNPDGFDAVFLCSSEKSTVNQAIELADSGAKIVVVGWFTNPLSLNLKDITLNELEIIGSLAYNPDDFRTALACLDEDRIPFTGIISHVFPLDEVDTAMNCLINREDNPLKILLNFEE